MKLDVLAFGAHPDDVEMSCGGTLAKLVKEGKKVGIIDLTHGELGSRGSSEIRDKESEHAAKILGVHARENLSFRDVFFLEDEAHTFKVIETLRKYQPEIVLCNAILDRHPDHGKGAKLVRNAVFLSGLIKIKTYFNGEPQKLWRPKRFFHYIQDHNLVPDFIIDITDFYDQKMKSVAAHKSQFYDPKSTEPETYISTPDFWDFFQTRAHNTGHIIGVKYGEGFMAETPLKVNDIMNLI